MNFDLLIFALFILSVSAVTVGCLLPARWLPPIKHDKWLHFIAFLGMSCLLKMLILSHTDLLQCLFGLFVMGLAIESLQHWVPGRQFCWRDLAANTAGICAVALPSIFINYWFA
jgi:VanZ family protein